MKWSELTLGGINNICQHFNCNDTCPLSTICKDYKEFNLTRIDLDAEIEHEVFLCNKCGETFDKPSSDKAYVGECWGQPAYEVYDVCPYCGSDNINMVEDILNGDI